MNSVRSNNKYIYTIKLQRYKDKKICNIFVMSPLKGQGTGGIGELGRLTSISRVGEIIEIYIYFTPPPEIVVPFMSKPWNSCGWEWKHMLSKIIRFFQGPGRWRGGGTSGLPNFPGRVLLLPLFGVSIEIKVLNSINRH